MPLFTSGCPGLGVVILVLFLMVRILPCLHHRCCVVVVVRCVACAVTWMAHTPVTSCLAPASRNTSPSLPCHTATVKTRLRLHLHQASTTRSPSRAVWTRPSVAWNFHSVAELCRNWNLGLRVSQVKPSNFHINRVPTPPGKSGIFFLENSRTWKVLEKALWPWKVLVIKA